MTHLVELTLENNWIGDRGLEALCKAVPQGAMKSLRFLALDENLIATKGLLTFARTCTDKDSLPKLEHVDLDGNGIDCVGMQALAQALSESKCLPSLKILEVDDDWLNGSIAVENGESDEESKRRDTS